MPEHERADVSHPDGGTNALASTTARNPPSGVGGRVLWSGPLDMIMEALFGLRHDHGVKMSVHSQLAPLKRLP